MKPHVIGSLVVAFTLGCGHQPPTQPLFAVASPQVHRAPAPSTDAADADPVTTTTTTTGDDCPTKLLGEGCPPHRTVVTTTSISILDHISFVRTSDKISPKSTPIMDAIAATLVGNPSILLVEVHAYGDDAPPSDRQASGERRARAIVAGLVKRGVQSSRLIAAGTAMPPKPGIGPGILILKRAP
jgi:outer membrane protein OmpA-like peptidoglycan-associated protein